MYTEDRLGIDQIRGHTPVALLRLWLSGIDYVLERRAVHRPVSCDAIRSLGTLHTAATVVATTFEPVFVA